MIVKEDLRVVKTKKLIKETFINLIEEKGFNDVSISDIAREANINRNTFYLHYEDKYDLLHSIIDDIATSVSDSFEQFLKEHPLGTKEMTKAALMVGIRKLLLIIDEEIELAKILVEDVGLKDEYIRFYKQGEEAIAKFFKIKDWKNNINFIFAYEGAFGVIKEWAFGYNIKQGETVRILADLIYKALYE